VSWLEAWAAPMLPGGLIQISSVFLSSTNPMARDEAIPRRFWGGMIVWAEAYELAAD